MWIDRSELKEFNNKFLAWYKDYENAMLMMSVAESDFEKTVPIDTGYCETSITVNRGGYEFTNSLKERAPVMDRSYYLTCSTKISELTKYDFVYFIPENMLEMTIAGVNRLKNTKHLSFVLLDKLNCKEFDSDKIQFKTLCLMTNSRNILPGNNDAHLKHAAKELLPIEITDKEIDNLYYYSADYTFKDCKIKKLYTTDNHLPYLKDCMVEELYLTSFINDYHLYKDGLLGIQLNEKESLNKIAQKYKIYNKIVYINSQKDEEPIQFSMDENHYSSLYQLNLQASGIDINELIATIQDGYITNLEQSNADKREVYRKEQEERQEI